MAGPLRDAGPEIRFVVFGAPLHGPLAIAPDHGSRRLPAGLAVERRDAAAMKALHRVAPLATLHGESALMTAAMAAEAASTVTGRPRDSDPDAYLADTLGIVAALAEAHGPAAVVSDLNAHRLHAGPAWRRAQAASDPPDPRLLVQVIENAEPDGSLFLSTRGMRSLGAPDIAVPGVGGGWREAALAMLGRFVLMAGRGIAAEPGRAVVMPGLPEGLRVAGGIPAYAPYFDNRHVVIRAARRLLH